MEDLLQTPKSPLKPPGITHVHLMGLEAGQKMSTVARETDRRGQRGQSSWVKGEGPPEFEPISNVCIEWGDVAAGGLSGDFFLGSAKAVNWP